MSQRLPTNLITGFLGAGKTTAIRHLMSLKPADETWAIIVNEFGQVGVDEMAFDTQGDINITPLSGGCVCCQLGAELTRSLNQLLEQQTFDRLIIEPTGMGHPAGILDTLRKPFFSDRLDLRATICLIDPRQLLDPQVTQSETFRDQINLADVLIANKMDKADAAAETAFADLCSDIFPPKQVILTTEQGRIEPALLDYVSAGQLRAQFPDAHRHADETTHHTADAGHVHDHKHDHDHENAPLPCKPVRQINSGLERYSCGWVFHPDDIFPFDELEAFISSLQGIERLKGAFRLGYPWVFFNRVGDEISFDAISYRRDSRVEIIARAPLDWDAIETRLIEIATLGVNSPYRNI
ncbi:CobW family GTP-binding protein [Nitrincola sp. MINF-07-Sa-05]|uniref:CobW family GTP-binding protein n=1 Tax=Nitrincola salilacus TaxID=3400273 RepID=UPI0039180111